MSEEDFNLKGATEPITDAQILNDPDAMHWAEYFIHIRNERLEKDGVDIASDPGTMVGWFTNAFARGEWNSPHYNAWLDEYMKSLIQRDSDDLSAVGTDKEDHGKSWDGGSKSKSIVTAQDDRLMRWDKLKRKEPLFWIQYDEHGNQILVTNIDETRLKRKKNG